MTARYMKYNSFFMLMQLGPEFENLFLLWISNNTINALHLDRIYNLTERGSFIPTHWLMDTKRVKNLFVQLFLQYYLFLQEKYDSYKYIIS